jgi:hypothetical protein
MAKKTTSRKKGKRSKRKMRGTGDDLLNEVGMVAGTSVGILGTMIGLNALGSMAFVTPTGQKFLGGAPLVVGTTAQHFIKPGFFKSFFIGSAGAGLANVVQSNIPAINGIMVGDINGIQGRVKARMKKYAGLTVGNIRVGRQGYGNAVNESLRAEESYGS